MTTFTEGIKNFNSQPHKGADKIQRRSGENRQYFNSQPHKGADGDFDFFHGIPPISIHSPTRGLTIGEGLTDASNAFQFTAPQGG